MRLDKYRGVLGTKYPVHKAKEFGFYSEGDWEEYEQGGHMVRVAAIGWRRAKS